MSLGLTGSSIQPIFNDSIFLICRSGARSHDAANFLQKNGFNSVYNVINGFEGIKNKYGQRGFCCDYKIYI